MGWHDMFVNFLRVDWKKNVDPNIFVAQTKNHTPRQKKNNKLMVIFFNNGVVVHVVW